MKGSNKTALADAATGSVSRADAAPSSPAIQAARLRGKPQPEARELPPSAT